MAVKGAAFGSTSEIICGGNDITLSGHTIVAVLRTPTTDPGVDLLPLVGYQNTGPAFPFGLVLGYGGPGDEISVIYNNGANAWGVNNFHPGFNVYTMIVASVNSTGGTGRLHYTNDGTNWTRANADFGTPSTVGGTIDSIRMGVPGIAGLNGCEIAYLAVFQETGAIPADATVSTYVDYNVIEAKANKRFSTGRSLQGGGTVADTSGVGNNETSRTAISAGSVDVPSWFTNFEVSGLQRTVVGSGTAATTGLHAAHDSTFDCGNVANGDLLLVACTGTTGVATRPVWATPSKASGTATIGTVTQIGSADATGAFVNVTTAWRIPITGSGTLVLNYGDLVDTWGADIMVLKYVGHDSTTPVAGVVTATASGDLSNSTLGATPAAGDEVVVFMGADVDETATAWTFTGTDFTSRLEQATTTNFVMSLAATRAGSVSTSTTVNWPNENTSATLFGISGIAFIMKAASTGTSGSAAITLDNFTTAGTGSLEFSGSSAITLDNFTTAGTGSLSFIGSSAITLDDFTVSATGTAEFTGSAAITLDDFVVDADGENVPPIDGTAAITLDDFDVDASGALEFTGTAAITLDDFSVTADGSQLFTGTVAITLDDFVVDAAGAQEFMGQASITLDDFAVAGTGSQDFIASAAITLDDFVVDAEGEMDSEDFIGSVAITLDDFVVEADGEVENPDIEGTVAITLDDFTTNASGALEFTGTVAITLDDFVTSAQGLLEFIGSSAVVLNAFDVDADGQLEFVGASAITLNNFTVLGSGSVGAVEGRPRVWIGTFVRRPAKRWNGSAWVDRTVRVYNGTSWDIID